MWNKGKFFLLVFLIALEVGESRARAFTISPVYANPGSWNSDQQSVINQAIDDWTSRISFPGGNDQDIPITFKFTTLGTGTGAYLAQWQPSGNIAEPYSITPGTFHAIAVNTSFLNDDSFSIVGPLAGKYDMLTVIEHELGHALGFAPGVYSDNAWMNHISGNTFEAEGLSVQMLGDNAHVNVDGDLMYYILPKGERRGISSMDVAMLVSAYGYSATPVPEVGSLGILVTAGSMGPASAL